MSELRRYRKIVKSLVLLSIQSVYPLGKISFDEDEDSDDVNNIACTVKPHEGFHKNEIYKLNLIFRDNNQWPDVFVESDIFDKITTNQYKKNKGRSGNHHGICIKDLGYGYSFNKYFKQNCKNEWCNYLILLISTLNDYDNIAEKGNGIRHDFKSILTN